MRLKTETYSELKATLAGTGRRRPDDTWELTVSDRLDEVLAANTLSLLEDTMWALDAGRRTRAEHHDGDAFEITIAQLGEFIADWTSRFDTDRDPRSILECRLARRHWHNHAETLSSTAGLAPVVQLIEQAEHRDSSSSTSTPFGRSELATDRRLN